MPAHLRDDSWPSQFTVTDGRKWSVVSLFLFLVGWVNQLFMFILVKNGRSIPLSPVNAMMRTELTNFAQPAVMCFPIYRIHEFLTHL